jgi:hypothetical protein
MLTANLLQIHHDRVRRGSEVLYRVVEEDAARSCAMHGCPHPHLAIESAAAPMDVWWLNAFDSEADRQRVTDAYVSNLPLMEALADVRRRREGLLDIDADVFAAYTPELSRGDRHEVLGARFITVTIATGNDLPEGSVFETADGTHYVFTPAATYDLAAAAARRGPNALVFAVRPYWGMPARAWIAADPEFWSANPAASLK